MAANAEEPKKKQRLPVDVKPTAYKVIAKHAIDEEITIGDLVREALKEYFERKGIEIDLSMPQHGGLRRPKAETS